MEDIASILLKTLEPSNEVRRAAEQELEARTRKPGFALNLLRLLAAAGDGNPQTAMVKQIAAIKFKNIVRQNWTEENAECLTSNDREEIKRNILPLMIQVDPKTRAALSEAIRIIGLADFPQKWEYLLSDLTVQLGNSQDFTVLVGLLDTANSLFKMFRDTMGNDDIRIKLKFCLDNFAEPLLAIFKKVFSMIEGAQGNVSQLKDIFSALRLMTRIFYSLNTIDLPEFFEDHIDEWMTMFHTLLQYQNPALDSDDEDQPGIVEKLHSAIITNANLYVTKYEEEFQPYISRFTEATWALMMKTPSSQRYDDLVVKALKFLGTLVSNIRLKDLFRQVLGELVSKIVVPNVQLRESDKELFEDNPLDFIRSDIEGSNQETRRRGACDLVRSMCKYFEAETTTACNQLLSEMIAAKSMDSAVTVLIAVGVKSYTPLNGAIELNSNVQIDQFFKQFIVPDLTSQDVNSDPINKAAGIKFFSTFRNQMPKDVVVQMLPHLGRLLQANSFVVHSYAASCIERIFMIREGDLKARPVVFRFGPTELQPIFEPMLINLFTLLEKGTANEYVAKSVMRILSRADGPTVAASALSILPRLCNVVTQVAQSPQNPRFIHHLFESVSIIVRNSCRVNPALVDNFEGGLMPVLNSVLVNQVSELTSYVYQILALILELRPNGPSQGYLELFPVLLRPDVWANKGDVPGLIRLLEAYMYRAAAATVGSDPEKLKGLLGVFQKLLSVRSTADMSINLITGVVETLPMDVYRNYLRDLLQMMLLRVQSLSPNNTLFKQAVSVFFSVLIGKHGAMAVKDALESISTGVFDQVVLQLWCPSVNGIKLENNRKASMVGLIRILTEVPEMKSQAEKLGPILVAIVSTFANSSVTANIKTPEESLAELEEGGYASSFTRLVYARTESRDYFPDIPDPKSYAAKFIAQLASENPDMIRGLVQSQPPEFGKLLNTICTESGVQLPG